MKQAIFIYILFFTNFIFAQNERQIARDANNSYNKGLFVDSEVDYRKSILKNQEFEEAKFNLSDALFKQDRYDESISLLKELVSETKDKNIKSDAYYNMGNNFLKKQELEQAAEAYKNCLRINPDDEQARYNLSKTLSLMQKQNQENNNQQNQENNNEKDQNKNGGQTDGEEDLENDKKKSDQADTQDDSEAQKESNQKQQDSDKNDQSNNNDQYQSVDLSKDDIERILDALERDEQRVQEEMQKRKMQTKSKQLEKDW